MAKKDNRTKFIQKSSLNLRDKNEVIYKKSVLANGIKVITEEVPGIESFALGISINAGSRDDLPGKPGTAHFVEHGAFRRTLTRNSRQLASQFESVGAYTNAYTTKEFTCFYVRALKPHFKKTFELLTDVTFNPVFNEKDMEKERGIILEEIRSYDDDPEELIFDYGDDLVFGSHGLGYPILGTIGSAKNITTDDLKTFHKYYYTPQNIIVSSAGCLSHEQVLAQVELLLSGYSGETNGISRTLPQIIPARRISMAKGFQQTHILLCKSVPGMDSNEKYELAALNIMLGDGMSSRLYQHLRERHGLAYAIYSSLQLMSDIGAIDIYAGTERKSFSRIEKLIFDEIVKLIEKKITTTELNRTKEQLKSSTIMALESMSTRMQALAKSEFTLGYYEDINDTMSQINAVTLSTLKEAARKYLTPEDWSIVIFEPEEEEGEK